MIRKIILPLTLALICGFVRLDSLAQGKPAANKATEEIAAAANKFLVSLDDGQREAILVAC